MRSLVKLSVIFLKIKQSEQQQNLKDFEQFQ